MEILSISIAIVVVVRVIFHTLIVKGIASIAIGQELGLIVVVIVIEVLGIIVVIDIVVVIVVVVDRGPTSTF